MKWSFAIPARPEIGAYRVKKWFALLPVRLGSIEAGCTVEFRWLEKVYVLQWYHPLAYCHVGWGNVCFLSEAEYVRATEDLDGLLNELKVRNIQGSDKE